MSFLDLSIKDEYRTLIDNIVQDFYIPTLSEAVLYRRAVGYFSSSALIEVSKGLSGLINNGGKIQLVASPYLTKEDVEAIDQGYVLREEKVEEALLRDLSDEHGDYFSQKRLNLLAWLIANDKLDIKIVFTDTGSGIGMFHEKLGIMDDKEGNRIAFSGSLNETATAMSFNYEAVDVYCEWDNEKEAERVKGKVAAFESMWSDNEPNLVVYPFENIKQKIIEKYLREEPDFDIDQEQFSTSHNGNSQHDMDPTQPRIPDFVTLHDYQNEAIASWVGENYRGIFDMATGTGKTYTGLGAICRLTHDLGGKLAVVIVCPYQHLVEQWVEDLRVFNIDPIIGHSASKQKKWCEILENAIRYYKLNIPGKSFFCFICTNATFATVRVQKLMNKIAGNALFVADEAHNLGARNFQKKLPQHFEYRLGLSATLERHGDEEGTEALEAYFGKKCIEYTLDRAIEEKKLTPYRYYPILVYLSEEEYEAYETLTKDIGKNVVKGRGGKSKLTEYGKILAMKRARLVAAASGKIEALRETIMPYKDKNYILVYCGAANLLPEDEHGAVDDESELRQIDVVTRLLGNSLDMKVSQFTSKEDMDERTVLKQEFAEGKNLQALIAIKCLDEGVNIPQIRTAFILASTTNPKEYIQRRGRVLRLAEGKDYAEIYDFVTLPRPLDDVNNLPTEYTKYDKSLVVRELARMEEFSRIADNPMDSHELIWDIKEAYHIQDLPEDPDFEM